MFDDIKLEHNVQRTAPEKIYLQVGDDTLDFSKSFGELQRNGDVSWCADKVFDTDVAYVRADLLEAAQKRISEMKVTITAWETKWDGLFECDSAEDMAIKLQARIAELEAQQQSAEPVGEVTLVVDRDNYSMNERFVLDVDLYAPLPVGTKLYLAPPTEAAIREKALREAAEVCSGHGHMIDAHVSWVKKSILALADKPSSLEELLMKVAEETRRVAICAISDNRLVSELNLQAIVQRVLSTLD